MPDLWLDVDAALSEVPINLMPLIDDTDFKTREESVTYNQAGLDLLWNFVTTGGAFSQTAVTPTDTGGNYDWVNQGNGLYTIEIPASGGASINNDTEGFGWFSGFATGILPWRGPVIGFRAAGLNNALIDSAYSTTRGLAGTALPDAAADAAGGLPISDAGGLDLDAQKTDVAAILADTGTDGVLLSAGTGAKQISLSSGAVLLQATQTGVTIPTVTAVTNGVTIAAAQTVATVTDVTNAVKISAGTGAGQLDFTSGVVKANLAQILGTALTETAGLIAAGFKKFFNIATPTGTINSLPGAVPGANGGLVTTNGTKVNQTVDLTAGQSIAANGGTVATVTNLTNLPTMPNDWLTAAGLKADAVTEIQNGLATPTNITAGTITTVTNLTNAPTNGDLTATMKASVTTAASSSTPALSAAGVAAILDDPVIGTTTLRQAMRIVLAKMAGKAGGGGTSTITYRGIDDTSNVIVETVDANGNRSAVTITV